jgi:hypothetical protein
MAPKNTKGDKLSIVSVTKLTTRARDGIGFDIVIQSSAAHTLFVRSTRLAGRVERGVSGFAAMHRSVTYDITLNSFVLTDHNMDLEADVSEPDENDWVVPCKGSFIYEMSTMNGRKLWEYELSLVTPAEIPASGRMRLRLLFRRGKKKVVEEASRGSTPAWTEGPIYFNEHSLAVTLEDGVTIAFAIEPDFLSFIANW